MPLAAMSCREFSASHASNASSWFQRYLLPGFAFKAVVIGGGYATGRELAEFFLPSGPQGGLMAIVFAMVIWSMVCAGDILPRLRHVELELPGPSSNSCSAPFWVIFEVCYLLFIILILAVFGAAAGAIGAALLGWPPLIGTCCLIACISVVAAYGTASVEQLFKVGVNFPLCRVRDFRAVVVLRVR